MNAQLIQELFNNQESSTENVINSKPVKMQGLEHLSLVFKDSSGHAHVLIEAKEGYLEFDELRGISIGNMSYNLDETRVTRFYEYSCKHEQFHQIFFPFVMDIITGLSKGKNTLEAHKSSLKIWKYFFENPENALLSVKKETGLIGELLFLTNLLDFDKSATEYWNGPSGGIDFLINQNRIEVKTTLKNEHSHTINGLDQLEDKVHSILFLSSFLLQLSEGDNSNDISLASMYHKVSHLLREDPLQSDLFKKKLNQLNITPELAEIHDFRKYHIIDSKIYAVNFEFPRLVPESLISPLSSRISKIRYDVDLDGLDTSSLEELFS